MLNSFLDFIFPRTCIKCKTIIDKNNYFGLNICEKCYASIKKISPPFCKICGNPFNIEIEYHRVCENCKKKTPHYDFLYGAIEYDETALSIVHSFKYGAKYYLAQDMAHIMLNKIDADKTDYIIPVPLHFRKKRERGYNQAELLAKYIAKFIKLPIEKNILLRIKDTPSQSKLNHEERSMNIKDAFKVKTADKIKNKKILLIDDVTTTGATINECSKVLKKAGSKEVRALVFARAIKQY